ncbi:MAG: hypothetical protein V4659_11665 [Pseudomonadota bacterium]
MPPDPARNRWLAIVATRLAGSAGAVFGVILLARAQTNPERVLGAAIVLAALYLIATVPRALARKWRTPPE